MNFLIILAFCCVSNSEITLKNVMSIERFENGTEEERVKEIDNALQSLDGYREIVPTPDEYRILTAGLRHKNDAIRSGTAALLQGIFSKVKHGVSENLAFRRKQTVSMRGWGSDPSSVEYQKEDEVWFKSCYYLIDSSEIPDLDAYQAFKEHFRPRRCCGDVFEIIRPNFNLLSMLETRDLPTLQYAMRRQMKILEDRPALTEDENKRVTNIMRYCPCEETRSIAKKLLEMATDKTLTDEK